MSSTIAVLYRANIVALRERIVWLEAELSKRDAREDRLIDQIGRLGDVQERSVSLAERGRGR